MESRAIHICTDAATPLTGEVDMEELIATVPDAYTIRGLFFAELVAKLGDDFDKLKPKLSAPPQGRYLAFTSYPIRDHLRVIDAAACKLYPSVSNREAHRLWARAELDNFRKTMLGKAILSVVRDPVTMLVRYPEVLDVFTSGPRGRGKQEGPRAVMIELFNYFGSADYQLGLFEGFVMNFDLTPRIEVHSEEPSTLLFKIEWS